MIMVSVIIADDDSDTLDILTILLEERGIKVIARANDGEEASQLYLRLKPDVIILDLKMPNYDGHYAIEKIKQEDPLAKIVVVSAHLDKSFPANSVSAVLSKPYEIDELAKKITEIAK
jgi:CheY-like chemotaxis protein